MQDVNTRGGAFGPGGYGSGVFDGSMQISGLSGHNSAHSGSAYGLRSTASPAYQDGSLGGCSGSAAGYEQAAAGIGDCYGLHVHNADRPSRVSFGATDGDLLPWMEVDDRTKAMQTVLSVILKSQGFRGITVDGVLGPATCGATAWLGSVPAATFHSFPTIPYMHLLGDSQGAACETFTFPTKADGEVFVPVSIGPPLALPWGVPSESTKSVQADLNKDLVGHGYLPLSGDGVCGSLTCGAMRMAERDWGLDYLNKYGGNCEAFTEPTKAGGEVVNGDGAAIVDPNGNGAPELPVASAGINRGLLVGGLMGGALLIGLYAVSKSQGNA